MVPAGALPVPVSDGAYSTFIAQVRWAPALLGSFVWYRPGLCQCRFRNAIEACIGPESPNCIGLVPA